MVRLRSLVLASGFTGASAIVLPFGDVGQKLIGAFDKSDFKCDLPPVLSPTSDGVASADSLFSSKQALKKQVERHQAIVRVPSVCWDDMGSLETDKRWLPFRDLYPVLEKNYPHLHKKAKVEKINTFGLLYTIQGSDTSQKPILLTAHQDVVPVADESTWTYPPFEAHFDGEWLWGRGADDDKNSLTGIVSAVDALAAQSDWNPKRTILIALGYDEECAGRRGAGPISDLLTERYGNDSIAIVLDEGGYALNKLDDKTIYASPAVTEKGHLDIHFELRTKGGHSSIPLPHTGIGIVSEVVIALEANPYEPGIIKNGPVYKHLVCQARYSPDAQPKIAKFLKKDDLDGLAAEFASVSPSLRFIVQTSQAVDLISGGVKINAMPEVVTLAVNYRVAPQDSLVEVQHNIVKIIGDVVDKYGIKVEAYKGDKEYEEHVSQLNHKEPRPQSDVDYNATLVITSRGKSNVAPESPSSGPVWDVFAGTIRHTFAFKDGTVVPVPDVLTGNTDTRHYLHLSRNVYRWTPVPGREEGHMHTVDERVRMDDHLTMIKFYYDFVRNFDAADL
ncbi:hypothetical protein ACHAPJ_012024 [Fusarium lateritium]